MAILPRSPGIYRITCLVDNKVYIGSTTNLRKRCYWHRGDLRQQRHHNRHLQFAWDKHGAEAFTFEMVEAVEDVEQLHIREQYWLDRHEACNPAKGYNFGPSARAPFLGKPLSDEHRSKLRERNRGKEVAPHALKAAAEWHASDVGREWHQQHGRKIWAELSPMQRQCQHCGAMYETKIRRLSLKYCSNKCRAAARREAGKNKAPRTCIACGESFLCDKYGPTRYCSNKCSAASRSRNEKGLFE